MTPTHPPVTWPGGARFAFSIFDDTDLMTIRNGRPVYDHLTSLGMRITKSVWPVAPRGRPLVNGSTCAEPEYLAWVLALQAAGHEIGYHNASNYPSTRQKTLAALDRFEELFGHPPKVGADHAGNLEALYCGPKRVSAPWRQLYGTAGRIMRPDRPTFTGDEPASPYFWGDICRDRITYWRSFCFRRSNLLDVSPRLPYHDPRRPYVNYWFTSTDASDVPRLLRHFTSDALDRLERSGGVTILYTHLGHGAAPDGTLRPDVKAAFTRLSRRSVWVAPAGEVLDHLRGSAASTLLTDSDRRRLEARWVADRAVDSPLFRSRRRSGASPSGPARHPPRTNHPR